MLTSIIIENQGRIRIFNIGQRDVENVWPWQRSGFSVTDNFLIIISPKISFRILPSSGVFAVKRVLITSFIPLLYSDLDLEGYLEIMK